MNEQRPTLTQVQIIQSLAEAISWFEKELGWGVAPAELNHLTGRIGELFAATITRGQMALETNQRGYDVVSALNERVSVKTVTTSTQVMFNQNTFHFIDRVIILRVNIDEENGISVEEILDAPAGEAQRQMRVAGTKFVYTIPRGPREQRPVDQLAITASATYSDFEIVRYENAAIRILRNGVEQPLVVKEMLRPIAMELGVELFNSKGAIKNTQTLGADVIKALNSRTMALAPVSAG